MTAITLYDAPGHDVEADTPAGRMWFERRDTADVELPVMFPGLAIEVKREAAPAQTTEQILAGLRALGHCPGCYLGDDGPATHTYDHACEFGC